MKKLILFTLLAAGLTSLYYCTKDTNPAPLNENQLPPASIPEPVENVVARELPPPESAICNCLPGQILCRAECLFSECCMCYNPKVETGGCACYFGIAFCKTAPIGAAGTAAQVNQTIRFYPNRFRKWIQTLKTEGLKTGAIEQALSVMPPADDSTPNSTVEVAAGTYAGFSQSYKSFIESLSTGKRDHISQLLDKEAQAY